MTTRVKNALYITPSDEFKSIIILTPPRRSFDKTYEISYTYKKKYIKQRKGSNAIEIDISHKNVAVPPTNSEKMNIIISVRRRLQNNIQSKRVNWFYS